MKALSIRQPWAFAILHAGKRVENRTWATHYRGPILIHAAKGCTQDELADALDFMNERDVFRYMEDDRWPGLDNLPRGGIVGRARIVDCIGGPIPPSFHRGASDPAASPWFVGPWGFVLVDVEPLPFVPWRGALGLFDADTTTLPPEYSR